jgi:hypothetical protein
MMEIRQAEDDPGNGLLDPFRHTSGPPLPQICPTLYAPAFRLERIAFGERTGDLSLVDSSRGFPEVSAQCRRSK